MAKRTAISGSVSGQAQKILAGRGVGKKKDVVVQAEADAVKAELSSEAHSVDVSKVAPTSAGLGDGGLFSAMVASAAASGEGAGQSADGSGVATAASGGGISTGLLVAGGLGILGGVAAVAGGSGGKSSKAPPPNQVPLFAAAEVAVAVDEDKPLSNSVKATDGNADALTYAVGAAPTNGTVAVNADGTYVYTPKANYNGADSFTVTVSDGKGGSATQTVKVTVNAINDAPTFAAAEVTPTAFNEDNALAGTVRATDIESDALTYAVGTRPTNGSVTVSADGSYVYTPNANYNGADSFTVTASDGKGGTATQTVKLTINPVNDAPVITSATQAGVVAEDGVVSVTGKVTSSDADVGATAAYSGSKAGTYGTFTIDAATGAWKYDLGNNAAVVQALAAGETKTETFAVVVTDDKGATATQSVVVTVSGSNDAPKIETTTTATGAVAEDGTLSATGTVASSDVDNGKTVTYTGDRGGAYGVFRIDPVTGAWKYDLNNSGVNTLVQALDAGETKTETFTVTATDDKGATATQNVTVTVTGTNDLPVVSAISDRTVSFQEAAPTATVPTSKFVNVAGTDADGGVVTFTVPASTAVADIALAADGSGFTYTPKDINYHGTETITVRLIDAQGAGNFTEYSVQVFVTPNTAENQRIDNGLTKVTYNAAGSGLTAGDNFTFIDDSAQTTNVQIDNFQLGDKIQVSASASNYSFAVTGSGDLEITYIDTASGASNVILLKGVAVNAGFIEDETTAETQLGLGNFFLSLADGATNAFGTAVVGTSLDVDSDSNVNTFALFNAAGVDLAYVDDANLANRALIQGFGTGDTITVSNAAVSAYSFARDTNAGNDIVITYNNGGKINEIVLQGAATGATGTLDTLSAVEALLGAGFFKSISGGSGGSAVPFTPTATTLADNASGTVTFNAGTASIKFTDDAGVRSSIILQNFGSDDRISTNATFETVNGVTPSYNFAISETDPDDLVITFNNNGVLNEFILDEILAGKDFFIDNYATAKDAVGFDFMTFG